MASPAGTILSGCLFLLSIVLVEHFTLRWTIPAVGWMLLLGFGHPYRTAMLCLAFALLLFVMVAHFTAMRLYLQGMNLEPIRVSSEGGRA